MLFARLDDAEVARRSVHGWCETVAALGRCAPGLEEVRLPNAVGARADDRSGPLASNHYFDAVVVPYDGAPPEVATCHRATLLVAPPLFVAETQQHRRCVESADSTWCSHPSDCHLC